MFSTFFAPAAYVFSDVITVINTTKKRNEAVSMIPFFKLILFAINLTSLLFRNQLLHCLILYHFLRILWEVNVCLCDLISNI